MARIVFFLDESANRPEALMRLQKATGCSLSEIRGAIREDNALLDVELFDSQYDDHASLLRSVMACVDDFSLNYRIYELPEGESTVDDRHQIRIDVLRNILNEADAELRRQLGE